MKKIFIMCSFLGFTHIVHIVHANTNPKAVGLDTVLEIALKDSERVQAIKLGLKALDAEIEARDLALTPTLTSELGVFKDKKRIGGGASSNRGGASGLLDVTLEKPFATGTKVRALVSHDTFGSRNGNSELNIADWDFRVSQSLWRDGFGRGTRLRKESESFEKKSRKLSYLFELQQLITQIEFRYWDLVFTLKERDIRKKNLDRSVALEKWTQARVAQFAAEPTDLLQVQALLSTRKLDYSVAQNEIEIARGNINMYIPGQIPESWTLDLNTLERERVIHDLLAYEAETNREKKFQANKIVRIDGLIASYRGGQLETESKRVDDTLKPDFDIYASVGANGINERLGKSWNDAYKAQNPALRVGVNFSFAMDMHLKETQRQAAQLNALSQKTQAMGLIRESQVAWSELLRNIHNLKNQVREARLLSQLQNEKVNKERIRYQQGKTTTLQMTTFEIDAAESELRLYRLLRDLRKAETQARIFIIDDGEDVL